LRGVLRVRRTLSYAMVGTSSLYRGSSNQMWINLEGTSQLVDAVSFLFVVPELLGESQLKMLHDLIVGAAKNLGRSLLNLGRGLLPDNILKLLLAVGTASKASGFFDALSQAVRGYLLWTLFTLPFLVVLLPIAGIFILFHTGISGYLFLIFALVFVVIYVFVIALFFLTLGITVVISPEISMVRMVLFGAGATMFLLTRLVTAWQAFAHPLPA